MNPYALTDAYKKSGKSGIYVGQKASESGCQPGDSELTFVVPKGSAEAITATLRLNGNGTIVERLFNSTERRQEKLKHSTKRRAFGPAFFVRARRTEGHGRKPLMNFHLCR